MHRTGWTLALAILLSNSALAQVQMRPTPPPLVSAENEGWYLNGDPITYGGQFYYPAGAQVFFNANEMVRSGSHFGVPLFIRTTLEPFSIVFVPVGRGMLQPYERPRTGELAGTVGSRTPSFPVALGTSGAVAPAQAAAPPMLGEYVPGAEGTPADVRVPLEAEPTGTAGPVRRAQEPMHVRIGGRPTGINAVFIEYEGRKWFSSGTSIEVDPKTLSRLSDYHGFAVWRGAQDDRIYVATSRSGSLAVPYSSHKPAPVEAAASSKRIKSKE